MADRKIQPEIELWTTKYLKGCSDLRHGTNSLSPITKSTSPHNNTYYLTIKSTSSPQAAAVNSSPGVSHSGSYWLGSHLELLGKDALPSWSRPSAAVSPIPGWVSHSLSGYCPRVTAGSCSQVPHISLSSSFFTSVPFSQLSQAWNIYDDFTCPSGAGNSALPISALGVLQSQVDKNLWVAQQPACHLLSLSEF